MAGAADKRITSKPAALSSTRRRQRRTLFSDAQTVRRMSTRRPHCAKLHPMGTAQPTLRELGPDLLEISVFQLSRGLSMPFVMCAGYWVFAFQGYWIPAVLCLVILSFLTFG